jgi:hypothetical protein
MATKNDVTGDSIVSRSSNKNYSDGWDRIFGKKKDPYEEATGKPYDPTSRTEDFIFPKDGMGKGSEVESLPGLEDFDLCTISIVEDPIYPDAKINEDELEDFKFNDSPIVFNVTPAQRIKIEEWLTSTVYPAVVAKQKLDPRYSSWSLYMGKNGEEYPYEGAIGGGLTYSFTPTGLGDICKVRYSEFELDVTDYDNF